jgi:hypothetical protein
MSDREFGGECVCCSMLESESRLLFLILVILALRTLLEAPFSGFLGSFLKMQGIDTTPTLSPAFAFYKGWCGAEYVLSSFTPCLPWVLTLLHTQPEDYQSGICAIGVSNGTRRHARRTLNGKDGLNGEIYLKVSSVRLMISFTGSHSLMDGIYGYTNNAITSLNKKQLLPARLPFVECLHYMISSPSPLCACTVPMTSIIFSTFKWLYFLHAL